MIRIMFDADLVLAYLLRQNDEAESLVDILAQQDIYIFITDIGLDKITSVSSKMSSPEIAKELITTLQEDIAVYNTNPDLIRRASSLKLEDFESAVELICAIEMDLDAIVTQAPQNFSDSTLPIRSIKQVLYGNLFSNLLHKSYTDLDIEIGEDILNIFEHLSKYLILTASRMTAPYVQMRHGYCNHLIRTFHDDLEGQDFTSIRLLNPSSDDPRV